MNERVSLQREMCLAEQKRKHYTSINCLQTRKYFFIALSLLFNLSQRKLLLMPPIKGRRSSPTKIRLLLEPKNIRISFTGFSAQTMVVGCKISSMDTEKKQSHVNIWHDIMTSFCQAFGLISVNKDKLRSLWKIVKQVKKAQYDGPILEYTP